jgi:DNA-binding HxlR family transcriptional regulator
MLRNPKRQAGEAIQMTPVRGSTTGRPLMVALDLLGRRWSLRVLWELGAESLGPRELRERCDQVSPDVLYRRLRELTEAGLVEQDGQRRYRCTAIGRSLGTAIAPLDEWARGWAATSLP